MKEEFPTEFPKKIEIEGKEKGKKKKEVYVSTEDQIEICSKEMKEIAGKIDKLATDWNARISFGNQPSDLENLERLYERPINVLSAQLAAKKVQFELLGRDLKYEDEHDFHVDSLREG